MHLSGCAGLHGTREGQHVPLYLHKTLHTDVAPGRAMGPGAGELCPGGCQHAGSQALVWNTTVQALFLSGLYASLMVPNPAWPGRRAPCQGVWGEQPGSRGLRGELAQNKGSC